MILTAFLRLGVRLASSALIPVLLILGVLMAPVSCMCGASVPHGHSLFQLPHHHHSAGDNHQNADQSPDEHAGDFVHSPHPLMMDDPECDDPEHLHDLSGNFVLTNAMEQQDSAVIQAPPTSSFGQPMVLAQPSSVDTPPIDHCEPLTLPGTRTLEGMDTTPEIPPPRLASLI